MNQQFISYDLYTKNVVILDEKSKNIYMKDLIEELNKRAADYYILNLSEQEFYLFNFPSYEKTKKDIKIFYSTVQQLIDEIKKDSNVSIKSIKLKKEKEEGLLTLNYDEICGFVNYIISIIEHLKKKKKEEIVYNFSFKDEMPKIDIELNNIKLSKLIEKTNFIKEINICISNEQSKFEISDRPTININISVIQLFCLFYKAFFKNLLGLLIDLNIYEINKYFNKVINPYNIKEEEILKIGKNYKNYILGNLILMKNLTKVRKIRLKMYDSYQIELHQLMTQYFSKSMDELYEKKSSNSLQNFVIISVNENINYSPRFQNQFLFFQHILPGLEVEFNEFNINFNSLDPLLFSYINILLNRHDNLANIRMKFFNFDQVNNRKILINSYYYNIYNNGKSNPLISKFTLDINNINYENNDYKIYYNYINNINDNEDTNLVLLKDDVILNDLFPYFNYNLNTLLMIIENKISDPKSFLNSLDLNFCSGNNGINDLNFYNNYNTAIICFIYNFFVVLELNKKVSQLSSLSILMDDLTDEKEYIIKNIKNKIPYYRDIKCFNLNDVQLTHLHLNISNISLILPFQFFPVINLRELKLENLSYNDLDSLANALKNNKNLFKKLNTLEISLNYMIEDFKENLKILLKDCILQNIRKFGLVVNNYISFEDLIDMVTCIKRNKSKANIRLKLSVNKLSPTVNTTYFDQIINNDKKQYFKTEFSKRNVIADINCMENKKIFFKIKMLNTDDINYYLKFIYAFNKIYSRRPNNNEKKNNNQKIFENIFYYMGKFRNADKEIRIEII